MTRRAAAAAAAAAAAKKKKKPETVNFRHFSLKMTKINYKVSFLDYFNDVHSQN